MLLSLFATAVSVLPSPQPPRPVPRNVAIVIYEGVELLDFAGPGEVFSAVHTDAGMAFRVYTVAASREPVVSQGFVHVTPTYTYDDCPEPDIVVVPGGNAPIGDLDLRAFVRASADGGELVMSVCNGAGVLAAADLLDGLDVTTHRSALQLVQTIAPRARVLSNRRFVDHGHILTCAGVSAGIDGALHVVSRMCGKEVARATAHYMEYEWRPEEIAQLHAQAGEEVTGGTARGVLALLGDGEIADVLPRYRGLVQQDPEAYSEMRVNRLGYTLLNASRGEQALRVLELAAAAYPSSSNACDSLAEAHEALGHADEARHWSTRALELVEQDGSLQAERAARIREASSDRLQRVGEGRSEAVWICPPCGGACDAVRSSAPGRCGGAGCGMPLVQARPAEAP